MTWRGFGESSFWPGRLDLLTYDAAGLKPLGGVVFDSGKISTAELERLSLQVEDSEASDHLLLVADFEVR